MSESFANGGLLVIIKEYPNEAVIYQGQNIQAVIYQGYNIHKRASYDSQGFENKTVNDCLSHERNVKEVSMTGTAQELVQ